MTRTNPNRPEPPGTPPADPGAGAELGDDDAIADSEIARVIRTERREIARVGTGGEVEIAGPLVDPPAPVLEVSDADVDEAVARFATALAVDLVPWQRDILRATMRDLMRAGDVRLVAEPDVDAELAAGERDVDEILDAEDSDR